MKKTKKVPNRNYSLQNKRSKEAIFIARNNYNQNPSAKNLKNLKTAILNWADKIFPSKANQEISDFFSSLREEATPEEILVEVAAKGSDAGYLAETKNLLQQITDDSLASKVTGYFVDSAVKQGKASKEHLPSELQEEFGLILEAFACSHAGRDDEAREKLQRIGLRSPFLDWKLLLRGLIAYYQNEDDRCLENWQRLDPERWPFRLAAPLRFQIDSDFAKNQSAATQNVLKKKSNNLQNPLLQQLRYLQKLIHNEEKLPQAFRKAESLLPTLRKEFPESIPRLGSCFYWTIIHHGFPEDLKRHQRIFESDPLDPTYSRLEALILEGENRIEEACEAWQIFEREVAKNSHYFSEEQKIRARAMIWKRMGSICHTQERKRKELEKKPRSKKGKDGGTESYFLKSIKIDPDYHLPYILLFDWYVENQEIYDAKAIGRKFLGINPNHTIIRQNLGNLLLDEKNYSEAVHHLQLALKANPLDKKLRMNVGVAVNLYGRSLAQEGKIRDAQESFQAAIELVDPEKLHFVYCKWAACEFKNNKPEKAEELSAKAQEVMGGTRLGVVYCLLIELIHLKLTKLKSQYNKEFNQLLDQPPQPEAALALADIVTAHKVWNFNYHGQQTHEKKVFTYLRKATQANYTKQQLEQICKLLKSGRRREVGSEYCRLGQKKFPKDPVFLILEAELHIACKRVDRQTIFQKLTKARKLLAKVPDQSQTEDLQKRLEACEKEMWPSNPFGNIFSMMEIFEEMGFFEEF